MNIIVPIHVEALRVSGSTTQQAFDALYDFGEVGSFPLSSQGLVAAANFENKISAMKNEPGIHLHWSIPRAYTRGVQQPDGSLVFPALPNRWLITRFFKAGTQGDGKIKMWILESDAYGDVNTTAQNATPVNIPTMNTPGQGLPSLSPAKMGNLVPLDCGSSNYPCWKDGSADGGVDYLETNFQAPFAYGATFTAYYKNSRGAVGFYDSLEDLGIDLDSTTFSASYAVIGWVCNPANDVLNIILNGYDSQKYPNFEDFLHAVFEQQLKWQLDDYTGITTNNYQSAQSLLSGTVAGIGWNTPADSSYPTAIPDASGLTVAIGNNSAEAIAAYINGVQKGTSSQTPPDVVSNLEWLLNAFQYDQLSNLAASNMGVGQLDEYLHSKSFGSIAGGYIWTARKPGDPGGPATPNGGSEATLPLTLAKLLSQLNDTQQQHDATLDEIAMRQGKLFLDWSFHVDALYENVFKPQNYNNIQNDNSGAYLLDGLANLFPNFVQAGNYRPVSVPKTYPYTYSPDPFYIQAPSSPIPELSTYPFNTEANGAAEAVVEILLNWQLNIESAIPTGLNNLFNQLNTAYVLLKASQPTTNNSGLYISQAIQLLEKSATNPNNAQSVAESLSNSFELLSTMATQKTVIDNAVSTLLSIWDNSNKSGTLTKWLPITNGGVENSPYKGIFSQRSVQQNFQSWSANGAYPGTKSLIDLLVAPSGGGSPLALDVQKAAVYLAIGYIWANSTEGFVTYPSAYYVEMAECTVDAAIAAGKNASTALANAMASYNSLVNNFGQYLVDYASTADTGLIQLIINDLTAPSPAVTDAMAKLQALLGTGSGTLPAWSIPNMLETTKGSNWATIVQNLEAAWEGIGALLPQGHLAAILGGFLYGQVKEEYELVQVPADNYWQPNEPVIVLGEGKAGDQILKPIDRNGRSVLLPCRTDAELLQYQTTYPDNINNIDKIIAPKSSAILADIKSLLQESYLLIPEYFKSNVSSLELLAAANYCSNQQKPLINGVVLVPASGDPNNQLPFTNGKFPYFIAYNYWNPVSGSIVNNPAYADTFMPLMIYWVAEYVYPDTYNLSAETYPGNFLTNLFTSDEYTVDYQPSSLNNFQKQTGSNPNFMSLSGVISLSSAATANLQNGIVKYCKNELNYDPTQMPSQGDKDYQEKLDFFNAYQAFNNWDVLSQGLSGFNLSLLQQIQELQIPINIPADWPDKVQGIGMGNGGTENFWVTQFLHNQSQDWGADWSASSINTNIGQQGTEKVFFVPLRGGFMKIKKITLVDVFGRTVDVPMPNPTYVAESMQTTSGNYPSDTSQQLEAGAPSTAYNAYLPPRLTQPSRLKFHWVSADNPDGIGNFTELNPHPAASPICGWLMANHLDDTLMVYGADGQPLGSLGRQETHTHWYPVPGAQVFPIDNIPNPVLKAFMNGFVNPGPNTDFANFQNFLDLLDASQQFIISQNMKQDKGLAVLLGRPLVLAQATLKLDLMGRPFVSMDANSSNPTYIPWDGANSAFQLSQSGYIAYNFDNFNDADIDNLSVPILLGDPQTKKQGSDPLPFFDDGLVGFFLNSGLNVFNPSDFATFYTPMDLGGQQYPGIVSTFNLTPDAYPIKLTPNGEEVTVTLLLDPRAMVRATSAILPVNSIAIPPDQYQKAMESLMAYFLTAPFLTFDYLENNKMEIPVPDEKGFDWYWYQVGSTDEQILAPQNNMDAVFPNNKVQHIIDGWLKLKKGSS